MKAKELGVEYVYKTRTDQRINGINVSAYLRKLQDIFPVQSNYMKSRLIGCSMTTLKYRPYGLGDMFMFGHIDDMLLYWDSKIDEREINNESLIDLSVLEYGKNRLAETYLCTNFLDRIGHDLSWTLKDTWHAYSSYFLVVDHMDLDLFWYKYNWREESRFNKESNHKLLHFRDWILLSSNDPSERESNYFNLKEGEKI